MYSQLSGVSLYSKCVEACASRSARHSSETFRRSRRSSFPLPWEKDRKKKGKKSRGIMWSGSASRIFLSRYWWRLSFRALEGCEAIIDLTHSTGLICDLSPTSWGARFLGRTIRPLVACFPYIFRNSKIKMINFKFSASIHYRKFYQIIYDLKTLWIIGGDCFVQQDAREVFPGVKWLAKMREENWPSFRESSVPFIITLPAGCK